jgi:hypothetical protein
MAIATQKDPLDITYDRPTARHDGTLNGVLVATQPQINFLVDLFEQKDLFKSPSFWDATNAMDVGELEQYLRRTVASMPNWTRKNASDTITALKALPNREKARTGGLMGSKWRADMHGDDDPVPGLFGSTGEMVPRGSYAIETPDRPGNPITFISVWVSDDASRWSVKMYVSDERVKLTRSQQHKFLDVIEQDVQGAAKRYGLLKCRCGICHRKLTREDSRERGIGPICAARYGWEF